MNILLHLARSLNVNIPITLCCILSKYDYQINLTPIFSYDCFSAFCMYCFIDNIPQISLIIQIKPLKFVYFQSTLILHTFISLPNETAGIFTSLQFIDIFAIACYIAFSSGLALRNFDPNMNKDFKQRYSVQKRSAANRLSLLLKTMILKQTYCPVTKSVYSNILYDPNFEILYKIKQ